MRGRSEEAELGEGEGWAGIRTFRKRQFGWGNTLNGFLGARGQKYKHSGCLVTTRG